MQIFMINFTYIYQMNTGVTGVQTDQKAQREKLCCDFNPQRQISFPDLDE